MKNSLPHQHLTDISQGAPTKRYSVLYLLDEEYHHISCDTYLHAQTILEGLSTDADQKPIGIYDAKTELFEWEPGRQQLYNQASIGEQGKQAEEIISIAQALRLQNGTS